MTLARSPGRLPHSLAARVLRGALPSFVAWPDQSLSLGQNREQKEEQKETHKQKQKQKQKHPTAYLDGLRGVASFIVFVCHYTELHHGYLTPAYGMGADSGRRDSWLQLPFARVLFSGRPMVHIFFVISGFVLSFKPLQLIHAGRLDASYHVLASSVFRRPLRLYLPCAVSTLLAAVLMQAGVLGGRAESWPLQLRSWAYAYVRSITWPWAWDHHMMPAYDIHLWTIPIEYAHSMLLFVALLGLSRLRTRLRQGLVLLLIAYAAWCGKWAAIEFLAGMFLAEVHVLASHSPGLPLTNASDSRERRQRTWWHMALHTCILLGCLFVMGWPNDGAEVTPGIAYLYAKTPAVFVRHGDGDGNWIVQLFWFSWCGILTVWSVGELPAVKRLFEGSVAQYCGKISYAIYIVHGPGLDLLQDVVLGRAGGNPASEQNGHGNGRGVRGLIGTDTPLQRTATWLAGLAVLAPLVVWMADLFWRLVDVPIVSLGRTVEGLCLDVEVKSESSKHGR